MLWNIAPRVIVTEFFPSVLAASIHIMLAASIMCQEKILHNSKILSA